VVNAKPQPFYPRLFGPQGPSGRVAKEKNLWLLWRIKPSALMLAVWRNSYGRH